MVDKFRPPGANYTVQRKVAGPHGFRLDGISDLTLRAAGASVFDIGCNKGMVSYNFFYRNGGGASVVHGCDIGEEVIETARAVFADHRDVESRFEVVDLSKGPDGLKVFGRDQYDIIIMLATYHKLKRQMSAESLSELMKHFGKMTKGYFGWRATSFQHEENEQEMEALDRDLGAAGLVRIQTSYISRELGVAAIWGRA